AARGQLVHREPTAGGGIEAPPVRTDITAEERSDLRRHPGGHMHAVGDRTDRNLRFGQAAPGVLPQSSRNRSVKAADTDRLVGEAQRGVGRAQPLAWITRSLPAQVHEAVERDSDLTEVRPEQLPD